MARIGPRTAIRSGDAQLVEFLDGTCSLVGRFETTDAAYIPMPPSVTFVAVWLGPPGKIPLPTGSEENGDKTVYRVNTGEAAALKIDFDRTTGRARRAGSEDDWSQARPPCPRGRLAPLVARR